MKKLLFAALILIAFASCKDTAKETSTEIETVTEVVTETPKREYPPNINAIFNAHGGVDHWNHMNTLQFKFEGRAGEEMNTVSLKDRRSLIETAGWAIGNDGTNVWLQNKEAEYGGNARFYHNLFFYFYAMPFVVADEGITYTDVPTTELDGVNYEGVKISYGAGVGDSPEDEYIVYYDAETKRMAWLGYTVTFNTNEKSQDWHFIKYANWNEVNGIILPSALVWYNVEEGKPTTERNTMDIETVAVNETMTSEDVFAMPEGAQSVAR